MNENKSNDAQDIEKPITYDANGSPLNGRPVINQTQTIHIARSVEPQKVEVSDAIKSKHEKSIKDYPRLNLSESEYVISAVRRHPIGMILPVCIGLFLIILSVIALLNITSVSSVLGTMIGDSIASVIMFASLMVFMCVVVIGIWAAIYVYRSNRFFLTNESVIQEIQTSLLSKHEQTVSLLNIEDASFYKSGILQQLFDYGTIRLSTEGDETTYLFSYVANPKREIAMLNNAVEAFKNGRPVEVY
jgi:uncharacterized membrane protein YdbT with pleckstrin-like domain